MSMATRGNGNITPSYSKKLVYNICEEPQTVQNSHGTVFYYDAARDMAAKVASGEVPGQPTCAVCDEWFGWVCLFVSHHLFHLSVSGITCLLAQ